MDKLVLYADDDADDRGWINDACAAVSWPCKLHFFENGHQVLNYLEKTSPQLPSMIVLDLNMPLLDGKQTLQQLKLHEVYKKVPVAIVSTSSSKLDRDVCRYLGAATFLVKPSSKNGWQEILRQLATLMQ